MKSCVHADWLLLRQDDAAAETALVDVNDPSDQQVENMEQERLVLQLKEMIRDRENALASKDADLKVSSNFDLHTPGHSFANPLTAYVPCSGPPSSAPSLESWIALWTWTSAAFHTCRCD